MACVKNLQDFLVGPIDSGGYWIYKGFLPLTSDPLVDPPSTGGNLPDTFSSMPSINSQVTASTTTGSGGPGGVAQVGTIPNPAGETDDNPAIDPTNGTEGYYFFSYTVGDTDFDGVIDPDECQSTTNTFIRVVDSVNSNGSSNATFCLSNLTPTFDLETLLTAGTDTDGSWMFSNYSGTGNEPNGCNTNAVLSGSVITNFDSLCVGVYSFTYTLTIESNPSYPVAPGCDNCDPIVLGIDITITDDPDSGTANPLTICN